VSGVCKGLANTSQIFVVFYDCIYWPDQILVPRIVDVEGGAVINDDVFYLNLACAPNIRPKSAVQSRLRPSANMTVKMAQSHQNHISE
jgi:hypothetical protein